MSRQFAVAACFLVLTVMGLVSSVTIPDPEPTVVNPVSRAGMSTAIPVLIDVELIYGESSIIGGLRERPGPPDHRLLRIRRLHDGRNPHAPFTYPMDQMYRRFPDERRESFEDIEHAPSHWRQMFPRIL